MSAASDILVAGRFAGSGGALPEPGLAGQAPHALTLNAKNPAVAGYLGIRASYRYKTPGSHNPIAGNMYSKKIAITWMPINGSIPINI